MAPSIRCHYEVLNVARDADAPTIKKAHRKLALKYHPDKNYGCEEAAREFRLVQQAYECLSDTKERKWYDEHRESILQGCKVGGDGAGSGDVNISFLFDVTPYHFSGCYDGYSDKEGGFFHTYETVFNKVMEGERKGWVSEGNIDENDMPNSHLPLNFGSGSSEWSDISSFYSAWESFSSSLSFAWADKYDPREADSRWERRRIDEENKKARKVAKRERNDDIVNLVSFVKKMDPRVKAAKISAEREKNARETEMKKEAQRRKADAAIAKKAWQAERERALREAEIEDMNAGRIRLADLDDSDDDYYGGRRGKKGKRGKKKKGKKNRWSDDENDIIDNFVQKNDEVVESAPGEETITDIDPKECIKDHFFVEVDKNEENHCINDKPQACESSCNETNYISEEDKEEKESDEEPEFWRCEYCRKDFKSDKQLENHLKSKKHKENLKKWEKKMKKKVQKDKIIEDMLDDITI